ncbi:MAG TPA: DUF2271 domain-containing protein [Ideonella sp.]|uniref:DUF2271 domain-containing protein n=1 Tax=Ideonella sp. TaxID=1929293 RepID=UPI002BFEC5E9|nr:DUF2271 domain-containing protein [Ideonella sp.]HSI49963.1 DUF2271 domain-containing protein [Ideonella sp.]
MQLRYSMALGSAVALSAPAWAAELQLRVEVPRLTVAEYHTPYVAVWLQSAADQKFAGNLAVWYDVKKRDNAGTKWLKDMRSWWRVSGRTLEMPVDGVSGATRAPGEHTLNLGNAKALAELPPGQYELLIEAAREGGGREVVKVPFAWPVKMADSSNVKGEHELGAVSLSVKP